MTVLIEIETDKYKFNYRILKPVYANCYFVRKSDGKIITIPPLADTEQLLKGLQKLDRVYATDEIDRIAQSYYE